jgi:hypothetical protein
MLELAERNRAEGGIEKEQFLLPLLAVFLESSTVLKK